MKRFTLLLLSLVPALWLCSCSNSIQTSHSLLELSQDIKKGKNTAFSKANNKSPLRWAKGPVSQLNLTGVSFDSSNKTATLISPIHVIMAKHHARRKGNSITFHDKKGRAHTATLTKVAHAPDGLDITVGRLDSAIPITPYRVLAPSSKHRRGLLLEPIAVTNRNGQVFIHSWLDVNQSYLTMARYPYISKNDRLAGRLITGDSGNPSFLWQNGEMILIETHHFGGYGKGPFISDPKVFPIINTLMEQVGGGYTLKTTTYRNINPDGDIPFL